MTKSRPIRELKFAKDTLSKGNSMVSSVTKVWIEIGQLHIDL